MSSQHGKRQRRHTSQHNQRPSSDAATSLSSQQHHAVQACCTSSSEQCARMPLLCLTCPEAVCAASGNQPTKKVSRKSAACAGLLISGSLKEGEPIKIVTITYQHMHYSLNNLVQLNASRCRRREESLEAGSLEPNQNTTTTDQRPTTKQTGTSHKNRPQRTSSRPPTTPPHV
jgi:hypothetical protein